MPDFDIDFCMDRREEVIQYVQQKYGRDRVGQIITFGALVVKSRRARYWPRFANALRAGRSSVRKMIPVEGVKPVSIEKALGRRAAASGRG